MLRDTRNLRAWYIEDLARLLEAIRLSSAGLNDAERRGFDLAVASIGAAIGLQEHEHEKQERGTATPVLHQA